jgi:nitrate reductase gamma subunit
VQCHFDVGRSPHKSIQGVQCLSCHPPHGEGLIHDPHLRVRCEACHHKSKLVRRDPASGLVGLARVDAEGKPLSLADHGRPDLQGDRFCQRCHFAGNPVQAPASALPAKSLLCFLCHPASLSIGGGWFGLALLIMLAGLAYLVWFWLRGGVGKGEGEQSLHAKIAQGAENAWRTLFSREFPSILAVIVLDVILQRRLLMESVRRWLVHSLIFLSILARMALGLFTWLVYQIAPQGSLAMALLDKNQGFVAFANDLLGLFILLGTILALVQRFWVKPDYALREGRDAIALALILLIAAVGFNLEAARIMMGRLPADIAVYSFVGYAAARIWSAVGFDPTAWYVYLWWTHALLAAGFAAYLPFGKMRHMFTAPLSLLINRKLA